MKKHHTNNNSNVDLITVKIESPRLKIFLLPKEEVDGLIKLLKRYQVDEKDTVPWKEGFKGLLEKSSSGGIAIRAEREMAKMTQVQLAEELNVTQHVISEMENGKRSIGKNMAKKLAVVFKTDYRLFL
ncbi:MAG: helix-turn-helix transcriptional regulator [Oligoflexia bacterium]|nr:helix-turn-helix transcriptional regulator [Oligoflexia bacterium]